jgi:hypothetical protein
MKDYLYSPQLVLFGKRNIVGFGDENFFVKEIDRNLANNIIIKNHYSGKVVANSYTHLGIFINNELLGVIQYGHPMNSNSGPSIVKNAKRGEYTELNRLWLSDSVGRNKESKALSYSIKYLKEKFPKLKWIQSFADERCGKLGIVYQASNFGYYGEHISTFWELDGVFYHDVVKTHTIKALHRSLNSPENKDRLKKHTFRQFRYLYFIDRKAKKDCLLTEKPYPKHYNQSN